MFLVSDFWTKVFKSPFYNWYSKNWTTGSTKAIRSMWGISSAHIQREQSFKGTKETEGDEHQKVKIPYAAATGAGVIVLLGILGQHRGLAQSCQIEAIQVLSRLCSCIVERSFVIRVLPDWDVNVKDLFVEMADFWGHHPPQFTKGLKQRCFVLTKAMVCSLLNHSNHQALYLWWFCFWVNNLL